MEILVVTGMSGAGKTTVHKYLEDMGYYCVDNMPPALVPKFASLCKEGGWVEKPAMIIDIRGKNFLDDLLPCLEALGNINTSYKILFLDATNEALVKRFKENRRSHPLSQGGRILEDIVFEREKLSQIKENSDFVIDTSNMNPNQLREELARVLNGQRKEDIFSVSVVSFGFKYGIPIDCDLVFDVRFIPNPFYIKDMKHLSGMDKQVDQYIMGFSETETFISKLNDMLDFLIPNYKREGKSQLVIGIGCTGGRHRSVAIGERLHRGLIEKGIKSTLEHRDIHRDGKKAQQLADK